MSPLEMVSTRERHDKEDKEETVEGQEDKETPLHSITEEYEEEMLELRLATTRMPTIVSSYQNPNPNPHRLPLQRVLSQTSHPHHHPRPHAEQPSSSTLFPPHPNSYSQSHQPSQPQQLFSLSLPLPLRPPSPPRDNFPPYYHHHQQQQQPPSRPSRPRRSPARSREGQSETVPAPYPWATKYRAKVRSLKDMLTKNITKIKGEVQCKRCEKLYEIEFNLSDKYSEMNTFIYSNMDEMHDRAPLAWMNPTLPSCRYCEQTNCVKPVISKKRNINWLFLYLGQMIGCCKLSELKYYCKHTKNHRTGAKDRVLYLTYLGIWNQLRCNCTDSEVCQVCNASASYQIT